MTAVIRFAWPPVLTAAYLAEAVWTFYDACCEALAGDFLPAAWHTVLTVAFLSWARSARRRWARISREAPVRS